MMPIFLPCNAAWDYLRSLDDITAPKAARTDTPIGASAQCCSSGMAGSGGSRTVEGELTAHLLEEGKPAPGTNASEVTSARAT